MPGRICKEILDGADALTQAVSCMKNSVALGHTEGVYAPYDLIEAFEKSAEETARAAQAVARSIKLGKDEKEYHK